MDTKINNKQSQKACFNSYSMHEDQITNFSLKLENWECEEYHILSKTLKSDEECVQQFSRVEAYKTLILENIFKVLSDKDADLLLGYIESMNEYCETIICIGNMIAYDAKTVKNKES